MSPKKLLLFDIDGTLLTTGGAGERGFGQAFLECFGIHDDLSTIDFAGATDTLIVNLLFAKHGLPFTMETHALFRSAYLTHLAANLPQRRGYLMPGIADLLPGLRQRPELALGLLTGNYEAGARTKLGFFGIEHYFAFGAFADDAPERNALGPIALARGRERHGVEAFRDPARDVLLIGDTPRDIACARACGAKIMAVATGRYLREELAVHSPDFLFDSLTDEGALDVLIGTM